MIRPDGREAVAWDPDVPIDEARRDFLVRAQAQELVQGTNSIRREEYFKGIARTTTGPPTFSALDLVAKGSEVEAAVPGYDGTRSASSPNKGRDRHHRETMPATSTDVGFGNLSRAGVHEGSRLSPDRGHRDATWTGGSCSAWRIGSARARGSSPTLLVVTANPLDKPQAAEPVRWAEVRRINGRPGRNYSPLAERTRSRASTAAASSGPSRTHPVHVPTDHARG